MKTFYFTAIIAAYLFICNNGILAQTVQTDSPEKVEYYKVSEVRIHIDNPSDITELRKQGLGFENMKLNDKSLDVMLDSYQINILKYTGYSYEVLIDDVTKDYLEKVQYPVWNDSNSLPIWMTLEEEKRKHEIGKNFLKSDAINGSVRNIAEFERMEGILVGYPNEGLGLPTRLISELSKHTIVYTLLRSTNDENNVKQLYYNSGANITNCKFIITTLNSYWTRDYGPWYIVDQDNKVGIVDLIYNRPRPADDSINIKLATYFDVPIYSIPLIHVGGNYMTDGWGIAASSDLVYQENSTNGSTWVNQQMEDYLGITTYHVTIDPLGGIKHIDCWGKFLDVDKVLIASVPESNSNYSKYEQVASYFASMTSSYGTPYKVFRVYSPNGQPYTNSVIINDKVYVPITNSPSDAAALEVYRNAMPGYTVTGFSSGTAPWLSSDGLHCRVMGLADRNMLYIKHLPLAGTLDYQPTYVISADIVPLSGKSLKTDSLFVIYKTNVRNFDTVSFVNISGTTFSATLPVNPGETEISYYLYAADNSGRRENHPFIGKPDPHKFTINPSATANFIACKNEIKFWPNPTSGPVNIDLTWNQIRNLEVKVFNILGEVIFRKGYLSGEQISFDLSNHVLGIYLLEMNVDGESVKRKIILERK